MISIVVTEHVGQWDTTYFFAVHMIKPTEINYGYYKTESFQKFYLFSLYFRIFLESYQSPNYQYVLSNFFCMVPL